MGKRNSIVVLSSDDEGNSSCYNSKSKSRPPVPRKGPKGSKKARLLHSSSERCKDSSKIDQVPFLYSAT